MNEFNENLKKRLARVEKEREKAEEQLRLAEIALDQAKIDSIKFEDEANDFFFHLNIYNLITLNNLLKHNDIFPIQ